MWHPVWEPLWNAVENVQLPLHFHTFPTTSPRAREGGSEGCFQVQRQRAIAPEQ
jgi:hypothetical protein